MAAPTSNSTARLVLGIGAFVLIGTPLLGYLWHTANDLLAGVFRPARVLIAFPVGFLLYAFMRFMRKTVNAWDALHGEVQCEEVS